MDRNETERRKDGIMVRRSSAGLGLFAAREFRKGETIIEYVGTRVPSSDEEVGTNRYLFRVNASWDIDGSPRWNTARYVNHSCRPNAEAVNRRGRIFIVARRRIREHEEITYDYGREYVERYIRECRCRACAGKKQNPVG
ncbi:MAG: SET domain-containing protein-lysine N-methyltransferase [Candidatus Moranbacteria bacterium]|nr:SET domain-containing protein-lysine N-methyltransferase [Candidatus Moranbacteria bacterium]NTW46066.1 SET domain-containing protein-lysine N-methyltransferase [Candidatus Moranbacteria bacterium]